MSEEMEIIKVETLPEPCKELLNEIYVASKKTNDKLPKGKYKCCGSGFSFGVKTMDTVEELRNYVFDNGEFKDIETGEFEELPEEEKPVEEVVEEKDFTAPPEETKEEVKEEPVKEQERRPIFETIKFLVIKDKEFFIKNNEETAYLKSGDDYKELVVPTEEEIKALEIKIKYKKINYFWSPIVDDEGE